MIREVSIFIFSFFLSYVAIKNVIYVAEVRDFFDTPTENRKIHKNKTPNLGGIGFLAAFIFSISIFIPQSEIPYSNYFMASGLILFFIGLKDDLVGMASLSKFIAQIVAATIIVVFADIRIHNFNGLFGLKELSYPLSMLLSIVFSVFIYNAINLIDGINGLAGSIGLFACMAFGTLFYLENSSVDVMIACALGGTLIAFLYFNVILKNIFMGDTGSLGLGFLLSILALRYLNLSSQNQHDFSAIPLVLSILILPIFDTLNVFFSRIIKGISPFTADDNHIHHRLLQLGLSHIQITGSLISFNVLVFLLNFTLKGISDLYLAFFDLLIMISVNSYVCMRCKRRIPSTT